MATVKEMMMQDAAASIETSYMMAVGDMFEGNLDGSMDSDWVAIELEAGTTYRISLSGRGMGDAMAEDTVLVLRDSKGGMIASNDDINSVGSPDNPANLNSRLMFSPEEDGTYYIDASSYNRIPGTDNSGTYTISVVALDLPADIEGTNANEKINGTDGAESIAGGGGDDTINAMGGDDEVDGGSGNDLITGGPGADMIKGGTGMDTISYEYSPMGVTVNLRSGTASGGDAEGDELASDIENLEGSMHDDMLSGSRGDNMIWGLGGMDNLYGDKGDDTLHGGMGDDELDGGDGMDTLVGGPGADVLTGGEDDDRASFAGSMMGVTVRLHTREIMGGDAEGDSWGDTTTVTYELPDEDGEMQEFEETVPDIVNLTGSGMADILAGDSRGNMIDGGGGDDKLYGGPGGGDDTLHGGKGDDMLFGGWGSDTLHGGAGDDMLNGGKEGDTAGVDTYYGGAGSDMIYANSDDSIDGWLPAFDADDPANTAPAEDADTPDDESTEAVSDPKAVDTVSFERLEKAVGSSAATRWTLDANATNVENLIGTSENDWLGGDSDEPNVIEGGDGADNLTGDADGTADSTADPDDTVSYRTSDRRVNVDLSGTTDIASGGHAQGDTIAGFENVIGSAHDDILVGDEAANKLTGLAGDDDITGGNGGDTIEGGAGADELDGDNGRAAGQTQALRAGDTLSYASSMAAVSANLAANSFSGGDAEGDEVAVQRGEDAEMLDHDNDPETDALDVSTFENLTGSMHNDRLTGDHRTNTIMGGDGDDTISGGGAMDVLMGQKGDDSIKGDAGPDHLVGGPGADRLDGGEMRGERDNMVDQATDGRDNDGNGTVDDETAGMIQATIDWAVYRMAEEGVEVDLSTNTGTGGEAMGDRLIGIELIWGSLHGDTIIAAADEDTFDIIHGDAGSDTVSYEASETGVTVDLSNDAHHTTAVATQATADDPIVFIGLPDGTDTAESQIAAGVGTEDPTTAGDAETNGAFGDRLASIENLTGSDHNDDLTGDENPNVLKGGAGNDELSGGDEGITGAGDMLYGGAGRDTLDGGSGNDTLDGGAGDDDLTGGGGNDTFVFAAGHGDDVITDAIAATEKIDLSAFDLDADDLIELISVRSGRVQIDLRGVGGGTIELAANPDLTALDSNTTLVDGEIDELSVYNDIDGDGTIDTTAGETDGVFIL